MLVLNRSLIRLMVGQKGKIIKEMARRAGERQGISYEKKNKRVNETKSASVGKGSTFKRCLRT